MTQKILILGVGNLLYGDEGVGVHAVRKLEAEYEFPESVQLFDGGTLGLSLMGYFLECSRLIVLDCIRGGHAPGSVYRLEGEGLRKSMGMSDSLHQLDLVDTLNLCELSHGYKPKTVVFGIEPENMRDMSVTLTEPVQANLPKLCNAVLDELCSCGFDASLRENL